MTQRNDARVAIVCPGDHEALRNATGESSRFADLRRYAVGQRCVFYGSSGASVATIREAFLEQPLKIIGFADDDPRQAHSRVAGYPVIGDLARLLAMIDAGDMDCVVVNTRVADVARLQALEAACRAAEVALVRIHLSLKPFHIAS